MIWFKSILNGFSASNQCGNDSWEIDDNDECQPKPEHFRLQCRSDGMRLELDKVLIPDAKEVSLKGDCSATFDSERKSFTWTFYWKALLYWNLLFLKISLNF